MRKGLAASFMIGTALLLAGCGDKTDGAGELEKGQVVATVNGKDVTIHELNAELQGVALPSGEKRKQIETAALQQIVNRRILARKSISISPRIPTISRSARYSRSTRSSFRRRRT